MNSGFSVDVIVPAAGRSSRYGGGVLSGGSKLDQDLGGRTVLLRTIEALSKRDEIRRIVVAAPPDDMDAFRERYGATLGFHGVAIVEGGRQERWETVANALGELNDDATHIAVHDAARPGVDDALLDRIFAAAREFPAVIPAVPIRGTIKRAAQAADRVQGDEDDVLADAILGGETRTNIDVRPVAETVDRTDLWEVQTPQVFLAALLRRAYAAADLAGVTDDAGLVERLGETVHLVEGAQTNFKITTPADMHLMRALFRTH